MTAQLAFVSLAPLGEPEEPLPPAPRVPANYGLVFSPGHRALVYAPTGEHVHCAGLAWTFDGSAWRPLASGTARADSVEQPWRALWDTARQSVVLWSWDFSSGPFGVVVAEGDTPPLVLSSRGAGEGLLTGDTPVRATDTRWDGCSAIFGFDSARGVTVCVNQAGLWELEGNVWRRRDVALDALPKEIAGSGFTSNGFGALYDTAHGRVIFWAQEHDEDTLSLVAWDGRTLSALDTTGLPDSLCSWRSGFAVGDHPAHGVVVLADGELFALRAPAGGFESLGKAADAPPAFSAAHLVFDPLLGELCLGPQNTETKAHRFFFFNGTRWRALGRAVTPSALNDLGSHPLFAQSARGSYAVGRDGLVASWDGREWRMVLSGDAVERVFEAPIQLAARAWNDQVHAISNDGAVYRLDEDTGEGLRWTRVVPKSADFGAASWPLMAYDPTRGLLVVWGERKRSKGRKDETFVCDGRAWTKAKKGKEKPEGLDAEDSGYFTLFFEPAARCVARLSGTQVALFDGETWSHTPHADGKLAVAWDHTPCVVAGRSDVLLVRRHVSEPEVVRLRRRGDRYTLTVVGTFEPPISRDPNSTGGNAAFDFGWFDAASGRYVAHFEDDARWTFALELSALFDSAS